MVRGVLTAEGCSSGLEAFSCGAVAPCRGAMRTLEKRASSSPNGQSAVLQTLSRVESLNRNFDKSISAIKEAIFHAAFSQCQLQALAGCCKLHRHAGRTPSLPGQRAPSLPGQSCVCSAVLEGPSRRGRVADLRCRGLLEQAQRRGDVCEHERAILLRLASCAGGAHAPDRASKSFGR